MKKDNYTRNKIRVGTYLHYDGTISVFRWLYKYIVVDLMVVDEGVEKKHDAFLVYEIDRETLFELEDVDEITIHKGENYFIQSECPITKYVRFFDADLPCEINIEEFVRERLDKTNDRFNKMPEKYWSLSKFLCEVGLTSDRLQRFFDE